MKKTMPPVRFKTVVVDTRLGIRPVKGSSKAPERTKRLGSKASIAGRAKVSPRSGRSLEVRAVEQSLRGITRREHVVYVPDNVQTTIAGQRVVHLQQEFLGLPVYDGRRSVFFGAEGTAAGTTTRKPLRIPPDTRTQPLLSGADAVMFAARYLAQDSAGALRITARRPQVLGQFASAMRATLFRRRPFRDPLTAHLALFPLFPRGRDVRLAWVVHLILPLPGEEYEVLVSADKRDSPEILLCRRTSACAVEGLVFDFDPATDTDRINRPFPRERKDYPDPSGPTPAGFPWPWVDGQSTEGNNVVCSVGYTGKTLKGTASATGTTFAPAQAERLGTDQRLLNAFYICNFLHDFFCLVGFDEAAGNFQQRNFTGAGEGNDRLVVLVHDSTDVVGSANLRSRMDGSPPEMNLGLLNDRHTALDAGVVIHEYVHGVTNRLIGGLRHHDPLSGENKKQSHAMGEGYSDYFALTILNYYRRKRQPQLSETFVFGSWVNKNDTKGWRDYAYDDTFPRTYRDLKNNPALDPHKAGQVWCYALLGINRALTAGGNGADLADETAWRIVVASLPLCGVGPDGPHFLDGKRAILATYDVMAGKGQIPGSVAAQRGAIQARFTQLGMGPLARSATANYDGIEADFGS